MKMKVVRLATIAKAINEKCPGFTAVIEKGYCNTDRHPKGVMWRIPGKGRRGNRLIVRDAKGQVVINHNSAETYRTNSEVMKKVERLWGRIWEPGVKPRRVKKV
jgi:hypothetical protein